jgi:protein-tyrosine phosphatase
MTTASFIDIHSHILPGVDDGSKSLEQSLTMAGDFVAGGVNHVFATPHHITGTAWTLTPEKIREMVMELQAVFQQHEIPLILYPGMEIALHHHLEKELVRNVLLPLGNSNCYLLEPPFQLFQDDLLDTVLSFKNTGKDVILAHPERAPFFQQRIASLTRLVEQGVMVQVNIGSLLGTFGEKAKTTALYLARHDSIHFIASDSHGPDARKPPTRKEWQQLEQILGPDRTQSACIDNPARLFGKP